MADLAATDVTITIEERWQTQRKRHSRVKIQFGDGVKTYPSGGVPMPAASAFGMARQLDYLKVIDDASGTLLVWKYDKVNKKFRGFWAFGGAGAAPVAAATAPVVTIPSGAVAVTSSSANPALVNAPGQMGEFVAATTTIAQQTIYAEAVGW